MAIALSDLVKDQTREDILDDLLTVAKALGLSTTSWQPGEPIWVVLTTFADVLAKAWNGTVADAIRAAFIDEARGGWLTLLAFTTYGVYRKPASFGTASIVIENRAGGYYPIAPGDITIANGNGKTFVNATGGILLAWPGLGQPFPTVELQFVADEAGAESSTPIGGIKAYPTSPPTAFAGVYARTNATAFIGAAVEDDDSLRERCRLSTGPLSPGGAKSAYSSVALSTKRPDGSYIECTRVKVLDNGGGSLTVFLASSTGPTPGSDLIDGSDVFLANLALQSTVVPPGITAYVQAAPARPVTVFVTAWVTRTSNVTEAEAIADMTAALTVYFAKLALGGNTTVPGGPGFIFREAVVAVALRSNPGIFQCQVYLDGIVADASISPGNVCVPTLLVHATVVTQS